MKIFYVLSMLMLTLCVNAQQKKVPGSLNRKIVQQYLDQNKSSLKLTDQDISNWIVTDEYSNEKTHITYLYAHQTVNQIRIFNAVSSVSVKDNQVKSFNSRFINGALQKINTSVVSSSPIEAIRKAFLNIGIDNSAEIKFASENKKLNQNYFTCTSVSDKQIRVEVVYQPVKNTLRLAYDVNVKPRKQDHWWNIRVDAVNGNILQRNDWASHENSTSQSHIPTNFLQSSTLPSTAPTTSAVNSYRVYPVPLEAPNFGPSVIVNDPADILSSPYGWHDTNGVTGPEYTTTRGNNVHAYDDQANVDMPGHSADGDTSLIFDFPVNFSQQPSTYLDASLTNLFYTNNIVHDVLYYYGFDEPSGNFQEKNYTGTGAGNDYVHAECQDGGGSNNANFYTPDDGDNGVMQMYIWSGAVQSTLTVNSPAPIAGNYNSIPAAFGPAITTSITADVVLADDGDGVTSDACEPLINASALAGKIALIDRGTCDFVFKVAAAQNAGAVGVIMVNNTSGGIIAMGDNGSGTVITIPSEMISLSDGNILKTSLETTVVNATLNAVSSTAVDIDGSLDNGVVVHEFGHGVSTRLTGGPGNSNCLGNGEQAGEGWSDFFALMFTTHPGDAGTTARGMGTFATGEPTTGGGIRRYPYSTDISIDPETYGLLAQSSEVHDIGEVWCTVLWDLNWALIAEDGFDADLKHGVAGNNIALQLVIEGLKLQPCSPGFLDGRDAILQADDNLYGGVHKCLIWTTFARRGMGFAADQGDNNTAGDETEDFTLPPLCLTPTNAPTANFNADNTTSCIGTIQFTDLSVNTPQAWSWNFGDGDTSNVQNPSHTYNTSGIYNVTLHVTNTLGVDSIIKNNYITINYPPTPVITGNLIVQSNSAATLAASVSTGNDAEWRDAAGNILFTGTPFITPALTSSQTYYVSQVIPTTISHVGPATTAIGTGGYHNTSFEGRLLFTTHAPMRLKSVLVDANSATVRTFNLYRGSTLINSMNINVSMGQSRVELNMDIPSPGNYQIGVAAGSNLYRNNAGATYPYSINGLVDITNSNSTSGANDYYYYLYDWEVQQLPCASPAVAVNVTVDNGTGIADVVTDGIRMFGNDNKLNIIFSEIPDQGKIIIYDPIGKILLQSELSRKKDFNYDLSSFASEFVIVRIDNKSRSFTRKITITH